MNVTCAINKVSYLVKRRRRSQIRSEYYRWKKKKKKKPSPTIIIKHGIFDEKPHTEDSSKCFTTIIKHRSSEQRNRLFSNISTVVRSLHSAVVFPPSFSSRAVWHADLLLFGFHSDATDPDGRAVLIVRHKNKTRERVRV